MVLRDGRALGGGSKDGIGGLGGLGDYGQECWLRVAMEAMVREFWLRAGLKEEVVGYGLE